MLTKIRHLRQAWHIIAPVGLLLVMPQCLGHAEGCRGEGNALRMILYLSCQRSSPEIKAEPMASSIFQTGLSQSMTWELSKDIMALKKAFEAGNLPVAAAKLQATLRSLEDVRLDIGITGGTGSGKSTFVNAIRGLGDEEPNSACTGVVEMTVNPTPYPHPKYPNVIFWDLPGVDAHTFQADDYFQRVLLGRYDFIIFITSPLHQILAAVQGPKTKVTKALVTDLLGQASKDASAFTRELLGVPVLGALATCGISFATVYQMLRKSLDMAVKDAQSVLVQASLDTSDHKLPENSNQ
ncbi:immunity-related GTPase family Q protein-like [Pteropus vampyrus]|uniref:Immunity-related GTPase family Q protein-like n=1 Tax=Pteropus vampyrus TaxID=132908 RepID=A0A6P6CUP8_PTEVA|nr:immunity-related GTPase family Q protein-like [Pteropus vampyrus]